MNDFPVVSIRIAGEEYVVRADSNEETEEDIQQAADYVEEKLRLLEERVPDEARDRLMLLCALNLALELVKERKLRNQEKQTISLLARRGEQCL